MPSEVRNRRRSVGRIGFSEGMARHEGSFSTLTLSSVAVKEAVREIWRCGTGRWSVAERFAGLDGADKGSKCEVIVNELESRGREVLANVSLLMSRFKSLRETAFLRP